MLGFEMSPAPAARDSGDHGTHTAATIAGRPVQGRHVGMAPGAMLASALVIEGGNAVARVLGGMDWAVGQRVRILSMSLGFRGWWEDFIPISRILRRRQVLPIFAVGNEGPGTSRSPGNYSQALSVGAIERDKTVADFSSSQEFTRSRDRIVPDLVGPGVAVTSARPGGGWQEMDGTSMATPHIAGLAALLMQARPKATIARVERAIFESCVRSAVDAARSGQPGAAGRPEGAGAPPEVGGPGRRRVASTMSKIDPELTRQLDEVGADDSPIQAVVYLESGETMSPDEVTATAQRIIDSASTKAATSPGRVNVLRNLGVVTLEGPASFVRSLIEEPGVASAVANVQPSADAGMEISKEAEPSPTDEGAAT